MNLVTAGTTASLPAISRARVGLRTGEWHLPAFVLLAGACGWITFWAATRLRLEDALITYRYAENLARGNGFVFNAGERVLGTTAPLQALLLAAIGAIAGVAVIPAASTVVMMLAGLGAGVLTYAALRRTGVPQAAALLAVAAFCAQPSTLWMATGGMETPLVVCLMAAGLYALTCRAHYLAAIAAALLVLVRIDGIVWSVLTCLVIVIRDRRRAIGPLAMAAAVVGPWLLFSEFYFGTIVPHTVIAKNAIRFVDAFTWRDHLRWLASGWLSMVPLGSTAGPLATLVLMAAGVAALRRLASSDVVAPLLVAYQVCFGLAFLAGKAPHFTWYLIPLSWSALVLGMVGLWHVASMLTARRLQVVATAGLVAYGVLLAYRDRQAVIEWRTHQTNEAMRRHVGDWLRTQTPANASVAMEAIGYQGFYSERRVIDLAGLVSPAVVAIHRESATHAEAFTRILNELQPDYIVLRSFEVDRNHNFHGGQLFETSDQRALFTSRYGEARRFAAAIPEFWGDLSSVTVYQRKPVSQ